MSFAPRRFGVVERAPVWMSMQERVLLYSLVFALQPERVLEIGTFKGGSALIICGAMDDLGFGRIVCVDPEPRLEPEVWPAISHRAVLVREASPGALKKAAAAAAGPFQLALIDGDHRYQGVVDDLVHTLPLLDDDAHVLLHDAHYYEVRAAIDDAVRHYGPELIDAGMVSTGETPHDGEAPAGAPPIGWGGLRLLRFRRGAVELSA